MHFQMHLVENHQQKKQGFGSVISRTSIAYKSSPNSRWPGPAHFSICSWLSRYHSNIQLFTITLHPCCSPNQVSLSHVLFHLLQHLHPYLLAHWFLLSEIRWPVTSHSTAPQTGQEPLVCSEVPPIYLTRPGFPIKIWTTPLEHPSRL